MQRLHSVKGLKQQQILKVSGSPYQTIIQESNQVLEIQTLEFRKNFTKCGFYFHSVFSDLVRRCKSSQHPAEEQCGTKGSMIMYQKASQGRWLITTLKVSVFVRWALLCPCSPRTSFGSTRVWTEFAVTVCFGPGFELKIKSSCI